MLSDVSLVFEARLTVVDDDVVQTCQPLQPSIQNSHSSFQ